MYTDVINTTTTISELPKTAGGTSTVQIVRRLAHMLKIRYLLVKLHIYDQDCESNDCTYNYNVNKYAYRCKKQNYNNI